MIGSTVAAIRNARPAGQRGMTLIELMIVLAILGIIAMVALPSYRQYNVKANRSQAAQMLLAIQSREEAYILDSRQYTNVLGSDGLNMIQEGWTCTPAGATSCTGRFYTVAVSVTSSTPPSYTITATPIATTYQNGDGNLTLTSTGIRARTAGDGKW